MEEQANRPHLPARFVLATLDLVVGVLFVRSEESLLKGGQRCVEIVGGFGRVG